MMEEGMSEEDFVEGYLDGRNPDAPEPSGNRSHSYRHSFRVGRGEITGQRAFRCFADALRAADQAERLDHPPGDMLAQ